MNRIELDRLVAGWRGPVLAALLTLGDPGGLEGSVRQFLSIAFGDAAAANQARLDNGVDAKLGLHPLNDAARAVG